MLRQRLTAWKAMKEQPNPMAHMELARELSLQKIDVPRFVGLGMVSRPLRKHIELLLRQNLIMDLMYSHILPELMCHTHRPERELSLPLPPTWRKYLKTRGVNFKPILPQIEWLFFQVKCYIKGLRGAVQLIRNCRNFPIAPTNGYAVLMNLPLDAVPSSFSSKTQQSNFTSWYANTDLRQEGERTIWAHVTSNEDENRGDDLKIVKRQFPRIESSIDIMLFTGRVAWLLGLTFLWFLMGRWWAPLLLNDAVQLTYCKTLGGNKLAQSYVFNNSEWARRPLWTYFAEENKSRIIMGFYSTNAEPFRYHNGAVDPIYLGYQLMSWTYYAVWDKDQADFIRSVTISKVKTIHIMGPIPLSDHSLELPELPKKSIAVFDITVWRPTKYACNGMAVSYYTPETVVSFLLETHKAISEKGWTMILKQKRGSKLKTDQLYAQAMEKLSSEKNVIVLDPNVNAVKLVEQSNAVISIPYTSTAILAKSVGKPSIYYNSNVSLLTGDGVKHGVPVYNNIEYLAQWITDLDNIEANKGHHIV